ncbi:hypothetical protein FRC17_003167 [Serendipita sp. 399]|nr:hypothetical protein FRC17_003167 [Serendipita sp. 399]
MSSRKKARRDERRLKEDPVWMNDEDKDSEEEQLEDLVFGGASFKQKVYVDHQEDTSGNEEHVEDSELFFFDSGGANGYQGTINSEDSQEGDQLDESPRISQKLSKPLTKPSKSKWVDPDDEELRISIASDKRLRKLRRTVEEDVITGNEYEERLRNQFEKINPVPQWANKSRKKRRRHEMEEDDEPISAVDKLLNTATSDIILPSTGHTLEKGTINIERLRDANQSSSTEGDVKAVMFHPSPSVSVMLSAGGDRRLKLFTIDGKTNPLLQTVHIPSLPIGSAAFHPSGATILLTGPRPFFFKYDLQSGVCSKSPRGLWGTLTSKVDDVEHSLEISAFSPAGDVLAVAGRQGRIYLVDWKSGSPQVITSLKMNNVVKSIWWNPAVSVTEQQELYTLGNNSDVYVWDVRSQTCSRRWKDDGGFGATQITGSPGNDFLAIGSKSGIVNVYGRRDSSSNPKPLKSLGNLTTSITDMHFNHNSELLVISSRVKKDQLRLVHLPSLSVYSNWPTFNSPLGRISTSAFSPSSEYLAIGNTGGRVLLLGNFIDVAGREALSCIPETLGLFREKTAHSQVLPKHGKKTIQLEKCVQAELPSVSLLQHLAKMKISSFLSFACLLVTVHAATVNDVLKRSGVVVQECKKPKTAALTWDDGPNDFEVFSQGHQIASHTWTHPDLTTLNDTAIYNELKKTEEAIENIIGLRPAYMRPPYGSTNTNVSRVAATLKEDVVIWNFDSQDWNVPANESIARYDAFIATNPSTVLALNHETYNTSAHVVLPYALKLLKKNGYKLVTVAECLGGDPYLKWRLRWPVVNPTKLKCT